jgi:hypothetical protein
VSFSIGGVSFSIAGVSFSTGGVSFSIGGVRCNAARGLLRRGIFDAAMQHLASP